MSKSPEHDLLSAVDHMDSVRDRLEAVMMMADSPIDYGAAYARIAYDALRDLAKAKKKVNRVRSASDDRRPV